ncbi:Glu/Leu/Phe/Val dehydrogenase dimerization domain-containing protein [Kibdelosporangium phytohabitans]|uniref:Glu/Leu/Phe/Val dehydrogenase dimerization domain-containing protein n=1 Tax=Kibdelosporangium phytohabitans TaxID=860235 RepID=UPI0019FDD9D6|nr:Glu/Leu/Phe/Val dehydrogenase dimerization domain-containing protein [Kibdelosporangium phytohabitans]MBE1471941.1 glutamate dehydrogenase (NAD(P)+) [Kibdelosporangium phytohabitans]
MIHQADSPYLQVIWHDPVTGRPGFLVIDRLVRGVCSGGLRMRPGCTLSEVAGLASGMTAKEALNYDPAGRYIPLGGAKGGIDFDPRDPAAVDVLRRYLTAVRPYIEQFWTMGEDLGLRQDTIDEVLAELGVRSSIQAIYPLVDDPAKARKRLADAFEISVDGVALDELVGGCGVAEAALAGIEHLNLSQPKAFVQGFGSMGGATARFLARAGVRVAGIADAAGVVANPGGLDVERLLLTRDRFGTVDRDQLRPGDQQLPLSAWLDVEASVLVPAAVSYAIDDAGKVRADLIVEAANMPVTAAAEVQLSERGILIIPDVVANSATNSWWWWTFFGDVEADADAAFGRIRQSMRQLVGRVLNRAEQEATIPRAAAAALAAEASDVISRRFGAARA